MIHKITLILRGYDLSSALAVAREAEKYACFNIEVASNSENAFAEIEAIRSLHLGNVPVGAGTVTDMALLQKAETVGAEFVLSPTCMSADMLAYCRRHNIISVPGAFTPSEILQMKDWGADIIKVFPASTLGPDYFKAVMAPLNHLPFMAVGGINASNAASYFEKGVDYVGIGSGICDRSALRNGDTLSLQENLKVLAALAGEYHG